MMDWVGYGQKWDYKMIFGRNSGIWSSGAELGYFLTDCDRIGYVGQTGDSKMIFGRSSGISPLGTELGHFLT